MLKIDVAECGGGARLTMDGQVIGPWVEELERVSGAILSRGGALRLDLAGVSFVSREGAHLLRRLESRGAAISGCSGFVAEQLKAAGPVESPDERAR
jgi:hypothetical protein